MVAHPINLSVEELKLSKVSSMAINNDSTRVYFGQKESFDRNRLNLSVLSLDTSGNVDGKIRRYQDSFGVPLEQGDSTTVNAIHYSAKYQKLYLGVTVGLGPYKSRFLTVYDLNSQGEPAGRPRTYVYPYLFDTPGNESIETIAFKETSDPNYLDLLYLSGYGCPGVYAYELDKDGEPVNTPVKYTILAISRKSGLTPTTIVVIGNTLFFGASANTLGWFDLDINSGFPSSVKGVVEINKNMSPAVASNEFREKFEADPTKATDYLDFYGTPESLYWVNKGEIAYLPIEITSNEHYKPSSNTQKSSSFPGSVIIPDPVSDAVWIASDSILNDTFDPGISAPVGYNPIQLSLNSSGNLMLRTDIAYPEQELRRPMRGVIAPGGYPVILSERIDPITLTNQTKDWYIQFKLMDVQYKNNNDVRNIIDFTVSFTLNNSAITRFKDSLSTRFSLGLGIPFSLSLDTSLWNNGGFIPLRTRDPDKRDEKGRDVNITGQQLFEVKTDTPLNLLTIEIEVYVHEDNPGTGGRFRLYKSLGPETVQGNNIFFLLPSYGFLTSSDRYQKTQLLSQLFEEYLALANLHEVPESERPKKFLVSGYSFTGGQGQLQQLQNAVDTLAVLGINNISTNYGVSSWGDIPLSNIDNIFRSKPFSRFIAVYNPLTQVGGVTTTPVPALGGYFDFTYTSSVQTDLLTWASEISTIVEKESGGNQTDVELLFIADEPGWKFDNVCQEIKNNPQWLETFRSFLRDDRGFSPTFFGPLDWNDIFPIGNSTSTDVESKRRLFYWTIRFIVESASKGINRAQASLTGSLLPNVKAVYVTLNRGFGEWHDYDKDGYRCGFIDWFVSGRLSAHTIVWEGRGNDRNAQQFSFHADLMRSAAQLGTQSIGAFVVGSNFSEISGGASYKILSLLGRGAKSLVLYAFGPTAFLSAGGNSWSDIPTVYPQIAEVTSLIGRAEDLLYDAQPLRGKVAIHVPHNSYLWDSNNSLKMYSNEVLYLHEALIHAGYTIDFVDDEDIKTGQLATRSYTTLYITSPNISEEAQQGIAAWVSSGHVLAATPGAGVAGIYNESVSTLDQILGVLPRKAIRDIDPGVFLQSKDEVSTLGGNLSLVGFVEPLISDTAVEIGHLTKAAGAGITINQYGNGKAIAYGFFPGLEYERSQYVNTPLGPLDRAIELPKWGKAQRDIAVMPARLANTPRPIVLSHEVVEACRLEIRDAANTLTGIAIILLNWTGESIPSLTVTIPDANAATLQNVKLAKGGSLISKQFIGDTTTVILSIKDVDILLIQ
jgi:hypothetical protein